MSSAWRFSLFLAKVKSAGVGDVDIDSRLTIGGNNQMCRWIREEGTYSANTACVESSQTRLAWSIIDTMGTRDGTSMTVYTCDCAKVRRAIVE